MALLLALGAALVFSQNQNSASNLPAGHSEGDGHNHGAETEQHSEGDGHDHGAESTQATGGDVAGGVTTLKIEEISVGKGKVAADGDNLSMNYKGSLLNGEVFDQSYGRGPFDFTLGAGRVIEGWDKGIKGMKEGGKRKLTIPASLGYGEAGRGDKIPGGATLVFEVELLKVTKN